MATWVPASTLEHTLHVKTSSCALISHMSCGQHRNAWIKFSENSITVVTSVHLLVFAHHPVGVVAFRAWSSAKQREFENNWSGLWVESKIGALICRTPCLLWIQAKQIKQRTTTKRKICLQSWKLQSSSKQFCCCFGGPVCSWCTVSTPLFFWRSASRAPNSHETGCNCDRKPAQHSWTAYGCNSALLVLIDMRTSTWPFFAFC